MTGALNVDDLVAIDVHVHVHQDLHGHLALDDEGAQGGGLGHSSILLSRSSSWSNRSRQKAPWRAIQSTSGARPRGSAR